MSHDTVDSPPSDVAPPAASPGPVYDVYKTAEPSHTSNYLWDPVLTLLQHYCPNGAVLDAGCGNGAFCKRLSEQRSDLQIFGYDLESEGIRIARQHVRDAKLSVFSGYDDVRKHFQRQFEAVVSLEVIEHLLYPRAFLRRIHEALAPDGILVLSTPYHGYLKNLALAVTGKLDEHFTALWDGGHIKFWSRRTCTTMLDECGFELISFQGAGRIPYLWKSMIIAAKPKRQQDRR